MSKVLVIGATGFIGQAVALSLLRSGNYLVYGLARSPAKAKQLAAFEIIPVAGSATDSENYLSLIRTAYINVVVLCGADAEAETILHDLKAAGRERIETARRVGILSPKLAVVYTSGNWLHGSSHEPVNDLDIVGHPLAPSPAPQLVTWRTAFESKFLASSNLLDIASVRPGLVYGRGSEDWSIYFSALREAAKGGADEVELPADSDSMPGLVHVDDAASGIHAVVERLPLFVGTGVHPVFDLQTSTESMGAILKAAAKYLGFNGKVNFVGPGVDEYAIAMNTSVNSNCGRARTLLGWEPRRIGMVSRMDIYAKAWLAAHE